MRRLLTSLLVPGIVLVAGAGGQAASIMLTANLTNATENPPTTPTLVSGALRPASFGTANFLLNTDNPAQPFMTFTATIFNIDFTGTQTADVNDNLMNAHIHAGATASPTTNEGVVWGFIGSPFNETNPNDMVSTPFTTGVGGTVRGKWDSLTTPPGPEGNGTTLSAQIDFILSNRAYINFHTVQFGGGEIRGFLTVVPEPSSVVLLGIGAVAIAGCGWRQRARCRTR